MLVCHPGGMLLALTRVRLFGQVHARLWTHLLDTTDQPVARSVDQVEQWITEQRAAHRSGRLSLTPGWTEAYEDRRAQHGVDVEQIAS